jgi:hypothetical protein
MALNKKPCQAAKSWAIDFRSTASLFFSDPNKEPEMKTTLAVLILLVVAVGTVYTQVPPLPSRNDQPGLPSVNDPNFGNLRPEPGQPSQPKEVTLDQLLDQIEKVRAQRAELEKKEKALMVEARKLFDKQAERINKLGLGTPGQPPAAVDFAVPSTASLTPTLPTPQSLPPTPAKR